MKMKILIVMSAVLACVPRSVFSAQVIEWPKDYITHDNSLSPDERFGILVPPLNEETGGDPDNSPNYLADLKSHSVIGKIDSVNYFQGENHAFLSVTWSEDSTLCLADYDARFGFSSLILLEPLAGNFRQTDLGTRIQKDLGAVISKEAHTSDDDPDCSANVRIDDDHRVSFCVVATTNPKQLDDVTTHCAYFQGTYDPAKASWITANSRPITASMYDTLSSAFLNLADTDYGDENSKAEGYDQELNVVYTALRFLLPKAQFEKIKASQIAWLKERDAAPDLAAKNLLVATRIKTLQDYLWTAP